MSTNHLGGRVIEGNQIKDEIIAFGESQLLGLDFSDNTKSAKHDLSKLFPSAPLIIYAAPNNGPLQALRQIERVHNIESLSNKKIVVGLTMALIYFVYKSTGIQKNLTRWICLNYNALLTFQVIMT